MLHFICFWYTTDNFFKLHSVKKSKLLYICVLVSFGFRESGEEISENRGRKVEKRKVFGENQFLVKISFFCENQLFMEISTGKSNYQMIPFTRKLAIHILLPPLYSPPGIKLHSVLILAWTSWPTRLFSNATLARKNASKTHQKRTKTASKLQFYVCISHVNPLIVVNGCKRRRTIWPWDPIDPTRVKTSW